MKQLNQLKIENQIVNNELHIYTDKTGENELVQYINYILTLIQDYYTNFNVVFHAGNAVYFIPANILRQYYSVQVMDRQGVIDLESMLVE